MKPVLVALGSNIEKELNLPRAIEKLRLSPSISLEAVSSIYETAPIDRNGELTEQPTFYNAAALLKTALPAVELHNALRSIESDLGRVRSSDKFAARTIDIDIVFYGQESIEVAGNILPDIDITYSSHLAIPLADIAPTWVHPATGQTLRELADTLRDTNPSPILKK